MDLQLTCEHYREAIDHEGCLVCSLLIDRKLFRRLRVKPDDCVDMLWRNMLAGLYVDPWLSVAELVGRACEPHAARTVADRIRSPSCGLDSVFLWNFDWHQREILRLSAIRCEFMKCVDFVLEHAA